MNGRQDFTFDRSRLLAGTLQNIPTGLVMAAGNYGDMATPLLLPTPNNVMRTNLSDICRSSAVGLASAHQQYHGRCTSSFSWNTGENISSFLSGANFGSVSSPVPPLHTTTSTDGHNVRTMWSPVTSNANDLMLSSGIHLDMMLPFAQQLSHLAPTYTTLSQEHGSPVVPYYTKAFDSPSYQKRDTWSESHKGLSSDNNNNNSSSSNICTKLSDYQQINSQTKDQAANKSCESYRSKKSKTSKACNKYESLLTSAATSVSSSPSLSLSPSLNTLCNRVELSLKKCSDRTLHPRCQNSPSKRKKSMSENFSSVQSDKVCYLPNDNVALNLSRDSTFSSSARKVDANAKQIASHEDSQLSRPISARPELDVPYRERSKSLASSVIATDLGIHTDVTLATATTAFTRTTNTTTTTTVVTSCVSSSRPSAGTFIQPLTISLKQKPPDAQALKKTRKYDADKLLYKVPDKNTIPVTVSNQQKSLDQPVVQLHPASCSSKNNRRIIVNDGIGCDATVKVKIPSMSLLKTSKKAIYKQHAPASELQPLNIESIDASSKKLNAVSNNIGEVTSVSIAANLKCNNYSVDSEHLTCAVEENTPTLLSSPTPSLACNSSAFTSSISPSYSTIAEDLWKASESGNESQTDPHESSTPSKPIAESDHDCDKKNKKQDDLQVTHVSLAAEEFTTEKSVTESINATLSNNEKTSEPITLPCKNKGRGPLTDALTNSLTNSVEKRRPLLSASKITDKPATLIKHNVQKVQPITIADRAMPMINKKTTQLRNISVAKNPNQVIYPAEVPATSSASLIFPVATNASSTVPAVSTAGIQPTNIAPQQETFTISALPKTISCTLSLNSVPLDTVAVTDQNFITATKITPLDNEAKTNLSVAQVVPVNMLATTACEKPPLPLKPADPLPENSIVLHNPTVSVNIPIGIAVARQRHEHTTTQTGIVASTGTWDESSRSALAPWITSSHTSTYWLPQNNYAATTAPFPLQFNSPDLTHLPFPPMGFQLVRDSITGHLLLIPTNIDLTDRTTVWPNYTTTTTQLQSAQPCQQVLIQQQVLQQDQPPTYDYRLPVTQQVPNFEPAKTQTTEIQTDDQGDLENNILDDSEHTLTDQLSQKLENDKGTTECSSVDASTSTQHEIITSPSMSGTNAFGLEDYGNSGILHLAQAVQTESGKRSQGTSPIPPEEYMSPSMEQIAQTVDDSSDDNSRMESDFSCTKQETPQVADASNQTETPTLSDAEDVGDENSVSVTSEDKSFATCAHETCDPGLVLNASNGMVDDACDTEEIDSHGLELLSNSITEHEEGTNQESAIENHSDNIVENSQQSVDKLPNSCSVNEAESRSTADIKFQNAGTPLHVTEESQDSEVPENMQGLGGLGLLCALAEQCFVEEKSKDGYVDDDQTHVSDNADDSAHTNQFSTSSLPSLENLAEKSDVPVSEIDSVVLDSATMTDKPVTETTDQSNQEEHPFEKSNGLGLLAEFACCVAKETDKPNVPSSSSACNITNHSATDNQVDKGSSQSEENSSSAGVKRKPGRPKKPYVKLTSITDYIPLKRMKIEIKPIPIPEDEIIKASPSPPNDLSPNLSPPKVSFLEDDAWHRRRSERIFLNDLNINPSDVNKTALSPPHLKPITEEILPSKSLTKTPDAVKTKKVAKIDSKVASPSKKAHKELRKPEFKSSIESCDKLPEKSKLADDSSPCVMSKSDSESSNSSSQDVDDVTDSEKEAPKTEIQPWLIKSEELADKLRVLTLKDGLFYAGHVNAIRAPDVYGITYDGERGNRPHIYSREEILKIALLELKVDDVCELSEGMRVCAYWSQQYRCLYPGTVKKCASPDPEADENTVYVEFDDGDSGRIPITDIRLLHHTFPIVSYDPNPLVYTGKRRYRLNSEPGTTKRNIDVKESFKKSRKSTDNSTETALVQPSFSQCQKAVKSQSSILNENKLVQPKSTVDKKIEKMPSLVISTKLNAENVIRSKINKLELKCSKSLEKMHSDSEAQGTAYVSSHDFLKAKKHKKHKDREYHDEHRHRHHHRHHHHHHKHKHKHHEKYINCTDQSPSNESTNLRIIKAHDSHRNLDGIAKKHQTFTAERKPSSELTVKIRTSSTELSQIEDSSSMEDAQNSSDDTDEIEEENKSSSDDTTDMQSTKTKKGQASRKRKKRPSSVESKSKMAAFLPARQLWRWAGNSFKRPKTKGKARKTFYKAITRGKETIVVGDCAVFLSTGRPHLPYIGRIETMWEAWGGNMIVRVKWFYHPEETKGGRRITDLKGALYQSLHVDENDVQTISHKCEVLSWSEYKKQFSLDMLQSSKYGSVFDNNDIYYLAGTYDPTTGYMQMEPGICS